ncbi:MAG TPA: aminotransferase class I/II-fold pyridoxal phosphate-dependent enzyme, partial [Anseongella sp.]|nr:aminotransferase class I/II-fold pyridoxal phosphate-dependent enzyme [Anseongella sp.]
MENGIRSTGTAAGRTLHSGDAEYLFFGGTNYLGMHVDKTFRSFMQEGLEKYGSAYGSSRASNMQLAVYGEAEEQLAGWLGTEACTLMSSGFLAGQLVARTFEAAGWRLHHAPGSHPALAAGLAGAPEGTWEEWSEGLLREIAPAPGKHLILADSIDPLRSRKYDFSFLEKLPSRKKLTLAVDDSHGLGVLGKKGEGAVETLPRRKNIELLILGSLGKGLGIPAGAVWARAALTKVLRQSPLFTGASPPAPACLYAFLKAGRLYRDARERLGENIARFEVLIAGCRAVKHTPGLPVFFLEDESAAARLLEQGIFLSSFAYPLAG